MKGYAGWIHYLEIVFGKVRFQLIILMIIFWISLESCGHFLIISSRSGNCPHRNAKFSAKSLFAIFVTFVFTIDCDFRETSCRSEGWGFESLREANAIFYLENFIRRYVLINRTAIKKSIQTKARVIVILNFLVERGSVAGYLLREDIL